MLNRSTMLNLFHVLVDGLFDSVPVLLAFVLLGSLNPEKEIGLVVSTGIALSTFLGLYTTFLTRKTSPFFLFVTALLVYGIAFLMAAFSPHDTMTKLCFVLAISVNSLFHVTAFSFLMTSTGKKERGKVISNFAAIGDVGRIPFVSFAAFVSAYTLFGFPGWRAVCLLFGACAVLLATYALSTHQSEKSSAQSIEKQTIRKGFLPSFALLKERACRLPMLASALDATCNASLFTFFPVLLLAKGVDIKSIVSYTFLFTFGSLVGKVVMGRLVDRVKPSYVFISLELTMAAVILAFIMSENNILHILLSLALGALSKGIVPVSQILVASPIKNTENYGDIINIRDFCNGIVSMLIPVLYGYLAVYLGINTIYILMACGAIMATIPVFLSFR